MEMLDVRYLEFLIALRSEADLVIARVESPVGQAEGTFFLQMGPDEVERAIAEVSRVSQGYVVRKGLRQDSDPVREIGERLFQALFRGEIYSLYRMAQARAEYDNMRLRLRLLLDSPELAALPWEFLHDGEDYLALSGRAVVVRRAPSKELLHPGPVPASALRMLVIGRRAGEIDSLWMPPQLQVTELKTADPEWLARDLPGSHIVDFEGPPELIFRRDRREAWVQSQIQPTRYPAWLVDMLQNSPELRLIFLFTGASYDLAHDLARRCPAVVGLRAAMSEEAALAFTESTLAGILDGQPLEAAVTRGRQSVSLLLPGGREWGLPVLYLGTADGRLFSVPEPQVKGISRSVEDLSVPKGSRKESKERQKLQTLLGIRRKNLDILERQALEPGQGSPEVQHEIETLRKAVARLEDDLAALP